MKVCTTCKESKSTRNFSKCAASKDGLKNQCKECIAIATKKYLEENKELVKGRKKKYYEDNKETVLKKHQIYRLNNLEKQRERDRLRDPLPERRFAKGKYAAAQRNLDWTLSLEEFTVLCKLPCYYCNNKIGDRSTSTYAALDRIDNKIGYTKENVLPCCSSCNYIRGDLLSVFETQKLIALLIQLRFKD